MGITLPTKTLHLEVGDKISLRAHNGKYLSVIGRPVNVMAVEAAKETLDDWCKFTILKIDPEKLTVVLGAQEGRILSVIARDGKLTIEAAKKEEPDEWCKFTVWQVSNANDIGKTFFALQAPEGANKLFCSVIGREGGLMPLEAEKAGIDEWSCFELTHLKD